jgi:hypothetical protein
MKAVCLTRTGEPSFRWLARSEPSPSQICAEELEPAINPRLEKARSEPKEPARPSAEKSARRE